MFWPTSNWLGIPRTGDLLQFSLSSTVSSSNLQITCTVQPEGQLSRLYGFALLINPNAITTAQTNGFYMDYETSNYAVGSTYSFLTLFSAYGPSFNSKCIFGFY